MARLSDLLKQDPQNGYISMAELDALEQAQRGRKLPRSSILPGEFADDAEMDQLFRQSAGVGQIPGNFGPGQGAFQRSGGPLVNLAPSQPEPMLDYANPIDVFGSKGYRLKGDSNRVLLNDGRMVTLNAGDVAGQQAMRAKQEAAQLDMDLKRAMLEEKRGGEWRDAGGGVLFNTKTGEIKPQGSGSVQPKLSATSEKELYEADEMANASQGVLGSLKAAKDMNSKAYSGVGALLRAKIASNFPGKTDPAADATIQLDNIIREQALTGMKAIFGGNPTEGERAILMEIQASADKTPEQRAAIIDRATQLAERRLKFNEGKAAMIRGGGVRSGMPKLEDPAPTQPAGGIKPFDAEKEARYQAWKRSQGAQ